MTDSTAIIIAAMSTIPASIAGIVGAYFSYRASVHAKEAVAISQQTEKNTNSMKDELVALTHKSSKAEGVLEGRAEVLKEKRGSKPRKAEP